MKSTKGRFLSAVYALCQDDVRKNNRRKLLTASLRRLNETAIQAEMKQRMQLTNKVALSKEMIVFQTQISDMDSLHSKNFKTLFLGLKYPSSDKNE